MANRTLKSGNRFVTRHFAVPPDVLGREHNFRFKNGTVSLALPTSDQVGGASGSDGLASISSRRTSDNEPLQIAIHKVDVEIRSDLTFPIPVDALTRSPNAFELFSEVQQNQLEAAAGEHQQRAEEAFHYWVRIMRWVCNDYRIAREEAPGFGSGWGTYLLDEETNHRVWAQSLMYTAQGHRCVTATEWNAVQVTLTEGVQPPVYIELKHDAQAQLDAGDYRRSLLDSAVACETYLRTIVIRNLPDSLNATLVTFIEEGNISQFINKLVPGILNETENQQFRRLKSDLHSLFERRNKLMHLGSAVNLNYETCEKYVALAEKLLAIQPGVCSNSQPEGGT
jgi:hypothetical protein